MSGWTPQLVNCSGGLGARDIPGTQAGNRDSLERADLLEPSGVDPVAQAVAEEIEAQHQQGDGQPRERWSGAARPSGGCGRRRASRPSSASAAARRGRGSSGTLRRRSRRPSRAWPARARRVRERQHVPDQDPRGRRAETPRRLHVLELSRLQHLAAHQARVAHPTDRRQRDHDVAQARAERGDERDRQQDAGERHQHVDHAADERVGPSACVARDRRRPRGPRARTPTPPTRRR